MKQRLLTFGLIVCYALVAMADSRQVLSPDGRLALTVSVEQGIATYSVAYDGRQLLLPSRLGLTTSDDNWASGVTLQGLSKVRQRSDSYTNIHGKARKVTCRWNEAVATLQGSNGKPLKVELRVYNDGVAFRYVLDEAAARRFTDEQTAWTMPEGARRWLQKFVTSYEGDFPMQQGAAQQGAWNYPALFETDGKFVLLTEANLSPMYCATHLDNGAEPNTYKVSYPFEWEGRGQGDVCPVWDGAWKSPWRIAIVGQLADVVASTLVDNVSDAPARGRRDWVKPGRAAWVYWAYNHGTKDFQICKQYVDLAVEMGWEYVLFDWEWDAMTNGGKLEDAVAYARSKGVMPWLWYNSGGEHTYVRATPLDRMLTHENRMEEFAWLKRIGIVGVKVDFFESDKQNIINYYLGILEDAEKMQMMVNFHGCTVPRGWSRTYPHLMSQEAVYGAEQYNNAPYMTSNGARINCLLPYTRNVVGPMDYTPVAFTNSQHPHETSWVHELALSVAFESGVQHWADRPAGFLNLPAEAKAHMQEVPVVWDETRLLDGYPGEYVVMARRSGKTWYVAVLNGTKQPIDIAVRLPLPKGKYRVTTFTDGKQQEQMDIRQTTIDNGTLATSVKCLPQGGALLVLKK
ncbi:MAG: glycoside hydrolase family 97 protein [Prevotella sp.]|nr:glycoside hydrolase family 97 protein [Prevotella sp.]